MGRQSGSRNLTESILSRMPGHPSRWFAFAEICMNKRERLPDASSRDTRRFLPWLANGTYHAFRLCAWRDISAFNMGIRAPAMGREERERGGKRGGQAVCLFRFQRYGTTRERILINGSSFTRTPDLSEEDLRLPASPLFPAALQSDYLFLFFSSVSEPFWHSSRPSHLFSSPFPETPLFLQFLSFYDSSPSPFYLPVDPRRTGRLRYSRSLGVMSSMKRYTWRCHLSLRGLRYIYVLDTCTEKQEKQKK